MSANPGVLPPSCSSLTFFKAAAFLHVFKPCRTLTLIFVALRTRGFKYGKVVLAYLIFIFSPILFLQPLYDPSKEPKKNRYITKALTRDSLGWDSFASCPEAGWSKGSVTTTFLQFLEHVAAQRDLENSADERLRLTDAWFPIGRKDYDVDF